MLRVVAQHNLETLEHIRNSDAGSRHTGFAAAHAWRADDQGGSMSSLRYAWRGGVGLNAMQD
jgi:hypothetical protein